MDLAELQQLGKTHDGGYAAPAGAQAAATTQPSPSGGYVPPPAQPALGSIQKDTKRPAPEDVFDHDTLMKALKWSNVAPDAKDRFNTLTSILSEKYPGVKVVPAQPAHEETVNGIPRPITQDMRPIAILPDGRRTQPIQLPSLFSSEGLEARWPSLRQEGAALGTSALVTPFASMGGPIAGLGAAVGSYQAVKEGFNESNKAHGTIDTRSALSHIADTTEDVGTNLTTGGVGGLFTKLLGDITGSALKKVYAPTEPELPASIKAADAYDELGIPKDRSMSKFTQIPEIKSKEAALDRSFLFGRAARTKAAEFESKLSGVGENKLIEASGGNPNYKLNDMNKFGSNIVENYSDRLSLEYHNNISQLYDKYTPEILKDNSKYPATVNDSNTYKFLTDTKKQLGRAFPSSMNALLQDLEDTGAHSPQLSPSAIQPLKFKDWLARRDQFGSGASVFDDMSAGQQRQLYGTMTEDAKAALGKEAEIHFQVTHGYAPPPSFGSSITERWKSIQSAYSEGKSALEGVRSLANTNEDNFVMNLLNSYKKGDDKLSTFFKMAEPQDAADFRAMIVKRISQKDGKFDSDTFLSNLFKTKESGAFDDIFPNNPKVSKLVDNLQTVLENESNKPKSLVSRPRNPELPIPKAVKAEIRIPIFHQIAEALDYNTIMNPKFVDWAVRGFQATKYNANGVGAWTGRLGSIAAQENDPELKQKYLTLRDDLNNTILPKGKQ